jgi:hypothetical protein
MVLLRRILRRPLYTDRIGRPYIGPVDRKLLLRKSLLSIIQCFVYVPYEK